MNEQRRQDVIDAAKAHLRALDEMRGAAHDPKNDILDASTIDEGMAVMDIVQQDCEATENALRAALRAAESAHAPPQAKGLPAWLEEAERRASAATDGPWKRLGTQGLDQDYLIRMPDGASFITGDAIYHDASDADFIASVRTDAPLAYATLREQAATIAKLIAHFDEHAWHDTGCGTRHPGPGECDCGFEDARKEVAAVKGVGK